MNCVSMENKVYTYIMYGEIHGHIVTDYIPGMIIEYELI